MGQRKRFEVRLNEEQRQELEHLVRQGTGRARVMTRARILLHADQAQHDHEVAAALHVHSATVANIRRKFVEHGLAGLCQSGAALSRPWPW
ncbi:helix-turn-helix domain-containing protein [Deinococcus planocerae]|uniref:helix-turn-helix domain-containing protein n=1 Tax=Deinococcus planocerae TaxID=1737569 RepID=UPI000C7EE299